MKLFKGLILVILAALIFLPGLVLGSSIPDIQRVWEPGNISFWTELISPTRLYHWTNLTLNMGDRYQTEPHAINLEFKVEIYRKRSWWQTDLLVAERWYDGWVFGSTSRTIFTGMQNESNYYWRFSKGNNGFRQYIENVWTGSSRLGH